MSRTIAVMLVTVTTACGSAEHAEPRETGAAAPAVKAAVPAAKSDPAAATTLDRESPYPPAVLNGEAELVCNISAKQNGVQKLTLRNGNGLEFDIAVSPIVDGTVNTKGPEHGGTYRFTSHLAKPAKAKLGGVGDVDLEELETKVSVEMKRYDQPGGPGTALSFTAADISDRGVYIEFTGRAKAENGDRYAFRVNLGATTGGNGKVEPMDANANSRIQGKVVIVRAPTTTVVTVTQKLP